MISACSFHWNTVYTMSWVMIIAAGLSTVFLLNAKTMLDVTLNLYAISNQIILTAIYLYMSYTNVITTV